MLCELNAYGWRVIKPILLSSAFAATMGETASGLVSVGRYALRGVGRPQDLFTIEVGG
jgi:adenylate cyclase